MSVTQVKMYVQEGPRAGDEVMLEIVRADPTPDNPFPQEQFVWSELDGTPITEPVHDWAHAYTSSANIAKHPPEFFQPKEPPPAPEPEPEPTYVPS